MSTRKTLKINSGAVNLPIVQLITSQADIKNSIFADQYEQVLSQLDTFIAKNSSNGDISKESANNIFSFIGGRGTGKTSCMLSVANLLTASRIFNFNNYENLCKCQFETIDVIDPSYFDDKHNIIAIMVASLYKEYKNLCENNPLKCDFDVQRALVEAFAKVQRSMRCLLDNREEDDFCDIESLCELSQAVDLKKDMKELVEKYMKFLRQNNGKLLLRIDDIDLNTEQAGVMAEQIRKYLVSDNIIVFMALDIDQLSTIKNLQYAKQYQELIKEKEMSVSAIRDMTNLYITKLLPQDQRIYLPEGDLNLEYILEIDGVEYSVVKQAIPEMIFKKTRYLFYNSTHHVSEIVPRNLRKLCQVASVLKNMHDKNIEANKAVFKDYLFGTWVNDNLNSSMKEDVVKLLNGLREGIFQRIVLDILRERYKDCFDLPVTDLDYDESVKGEIKQILDRRNLDYNISIGDITGIIYWLQKRLKDKENSMFLFMVNTICSMGLYENYDLFTESHNSNTDNNNGTVLRHDPFGDFGLSEYQKMIGGRFYNYRLVPRVMDREKVGNKHKARTDRIINYSELQKLIKKTVDLWKEYNNANNSDIKDELQKYVRLSEFFMLCISREINTQNKMQGDIDFYEPEFRRGDRVYYAGKITSKKNIFFDLGTFFYNILNVKQCYEREKESGAELFKLADTENEGISIWSEFKRYAVENRPSYEHDPDHAWKSCASIRNTDVIYDLQQVLASVEHKSGGNRDQLQKYFDDIQKYEIKTYDKDGKNDPYYKIEFKFVEPIARLLARNDIEDSFNAIFNNEAESEENNTDGFDKAKILRGLRNDNSNRKETVIKRFKKQPAYSKYSDIVDPILESLSNRLTKEEISDAVDRINTEIASRQNG